MERMIRSRSRFRSRRPATMIADMGRPGNTQHSSPADRTVGKDANSSGSRSSVMGSLAEGTRE